MTLSKSESMRARIIPRLAPSSIPSIRLLKYGTSDLAEKFLLMLRDIMLDCVSHVSMVRRHAVNIIIIIARRSSEGPAESA